MRPGKQYDNVIECQDISKDSEFNKSLEKKLNRNIKDFVCYEVQEWLNAVTDSRKLSVLRTGI